MFDIFKPKTIHHKKDFFEKGTFILLFLGLLIAGMVLGKDILIPLGFGALFAFLMFPISKWLEKKKVKRSLSAVICILIITLVIAVVISLLSSQLISFSERLKEFESIAVKKFDAISDWIENTVGISGEEQNKWIKQKTNQALQNSGSAIGGFLNGFANTFANLVIIPIFTFFFLVYRRKFKKFILMLTNPENHLRVNKIINETGTVVLAYLRGVITVIFILAVINTTMLFAFGIPYALFLGVLAAILNVIPYIGVLIGSGFGILMAFITKEESWIPVGVAISFWLVQLFENNYLTPKITGSKVSINPFMTILILLVGGAIWGVAGMILFIPLLGILKVIFENIKKTKPFAYLISEDE